jgi:hypothetical protein
MSTIRGALLAHGVQVAEIPGRPKNLWGIWRKMQAKNVAFEGLSDVMAFRIIVPERAQCYAALGAIHDAFKVIAGRFKDYISTPKPNGYQSIHTTVIGPEKQRIEVQIRTRNMHEVADMGVAAERGIWRQHGVVPRRGIVAERRVVVQKRAHADRGRIAHDRIGADNGTGADGSGWSHNCRWMNQGQEHTASRLE